MSFKRFLPLFTLLTLALSFAVGSPATALAAAPAQTPPPAVIFGPGRLNIVPSAAWLRAKNEHRIVVHNGQLTILSSSPLFSYPSVDILPYARPYGVSGETYEPPPTSTDSAGNSYNDGYYGNFCAAGASTVTLSYWPILTHAGSQGQASNWAGGQNLPFTEPSTATRRITTHWNDGGLRAYLMYLAEQVLVPGWTTPGEVTFQTYPYAYTATGDIVNVLNWEAKEHGSGWQNFFYGQVAAGSLSQSQLNSDIMSDVYGNDPLAQVSPVIAVVNAKDLPSWSITKTIIHAIAIIGYDNTSQTYTYVETCGGPRTQSGTCGSNGQGVYTISQSQLYNAIQDTGGNGGIVW